MLELAGHLTWSRHEKRGASRYRVQQSAIATLVKYAIYQDTDESDVQQASNWCPVGRHYNANKLICLAVWITTCSTNYAAEVQN